MSYFGTTKIGKMFLGTTEIGKAYLGANLVFQKGGQPVEMIPYIRGGADGSYIDTGITPDNTTKIIVFARNINPGNGIVFGSRIALNNSMFVIGTYGSTNVGRIRFDIGNDINYSNDQFANLSGYHKYELYQGVLKVDDVVVGSGTNPSFSNSYNIYLFAMNNGGSLSSPNYPLDIHSVQIYKNGTLVRDFVATNSPSVGLYDSVSNTLFTNAGNGNFTYGTFNPNSYTPLEYVTLRNAQYIDTGIYGTRDLPVVLKFQPQTGGTSTWPDIFGTYTSGTSGTYFLLELGTENSIEGKVAYFYIGTSSPYQPYNNASVPLTGIDVVFLKENTTVQFVRNNATFGTSKTVNPSSSLSTPGTIYLGSSHKGGGVGNSMNGRIYFAGFGSQRNFVPAKVNNVAGLYETYSDTFYPSISGTDFIAGPEL